MAANNAPVFGRVPKIGRSGYLTTANTTADLTSGTSELVFTAEANDGSTIDFIRCRPTPAGNNVQTVVRVWLNNGGVLTTAGNNQLYDEVTLPAITASASASTQGITIPMGIALPPGWRVYVTIGTAVANGWQFSGVGRDLAA